MEQKEESGTNTQPSSMAFIPQWIYEWESQYKYKQPAQTFFVFVCMFVFPWPSIRARVCMYWFLPNE